MPWPKASDKHLMLFGHDVVSYFTDRKHQKGSPEIKSVYKGVTFRFASAEHKRMFDAGAREIHAAVRRLLHERLSSTASRGEATRQLGNSSTASCTYSAARARTMRSTST
jgi:YHS domain-containing protein